MTAGKTPTIETYVRSYQDRLDEAVELNLESLQSYHCLLETSLHRKAHESEVNLSAFMYSAQRLPACMYKTTRVMIGPNEQAFMEAGFTDIKRWPMVAARARRRRAHYDGRDTLALFTTSISDLDDIIPSLCAYQVEWNKMHSHLHRTTLGVPLAEGRLNPESAGDDLRRALGLSSVDWDMLIKALGREFNDLMIALAGSPKNFIIKRLPLRPQDFRQTNDLWWGKVIEEFPAGDATHRPIYLVSSNTHSLANLVSGFAADHYREILDVILENDSEEFQRIRRRLKWEPEIDRLNFIYYAQKLFLQHHPELEPERKNMEESAGLRRIFLSYSQPTEVQHLELGRLDPRRLDPRLTVRDWASLKKSRALIINMDYPLGYSAYHLLAWACRRFTCLRGVMVLGKSAAMIGRLGDIMIPSQVRDAHSGNLYHFTNCFTIRRLMPFLREIAAFEEQKSITVRGTFLHNWGEVKNFHKKDFTGIEMEAGPYLSALYEHLSDRPHPVNSDVRIETGPDFHFGLLHYTSDIPYNIRATLLSHRLGISGLEASYSCSLAIMQLILDMETNRR